jgi:hypothetical protein
MIQPLVFDVGGSLDHRRRNRVSGRENVFDVKQRGVLPLVNALSSDSELDAQEVRLRDDLVYPTLGLDSLGGVHRRHLSHSRVTV